ncbi:putative Cathepsin B [Paratrimastix pyriformis]|uniref:Cathepsin B n=1 Tax=Paratrimastix pyriformis TaxID=342808 RepID=A0ABQ8UM78_9EUKA|nr:putative Cathepsin B [Paratrimastix pyriformis]|eukprot:GAFH01002793.1.p2 GENE.GAFH01002793.1~~GAFH01002793.1.p2  ORF type:complete len:339 (-),score=102.07 GAFH01002793.1:57-1073(-)
MRALLLVFCAAAFALDLYAPAIQPEMVEQINSMNGVTWQAGMNGHFEGLNLKDVQRMLGVHPTPASERLPEKHHMKAISLPDEFDPRKEYGDRCPSTKMLRDQGGCGSCWAFAAAASITDRICIATKGAMNPIISAEDIVSCCSITHAPLECTSDKGCNGGQIKDPWSYWHSKGVVTGGLYGDTQTCQPYTIPPCEHHVDGPRPSCAGEDYKTPQCLRTCSNSSIDYKSDKTFGDKAYSVSGVQNIMQELVQHGPLSASLSVYEDFEAYKGGVYQHVKGSFLGLHAVSLIGYGVDNGTPYWLLKNSWNNDWGEGGFFRILRGKNECGIEGEIAGSVPM